MEKFLIALAFACIVLLALIVNNMEQELWGRINAMCDHINRTGVVDQLNCDSIKSRNVDFSTYHFNP